MHKFSSGGDKIHQERFFWIFFAIFLFFLTNVIFGCSPHRVGGGPCPSITFVNVMPWKTTTSQWISPKPMQSLFWRNGISSENSFINIGYGNLRADRSVCFLERVFLCYISSFGIWRFDHLNLALITHALAGSLKHLLWLDSTLILRRKCYSFGDAGHC